MIGCAYGEPALAELYEALNPWGPGDDNYLELIMSSRSLLDLEGRRVMTAEQLKSRTSEGFERMFNQGDLDYVDGMVAPGAIDHQEPEGTDIAAHLKDVISTLRAAFPDLRFEVHELVCEGDVVASRSTMTGTHQGPLRIGPLAGLPVAGVRVEVPHMHFFRYDDEGRVTDLWHVWNTLLLARQLGAPAPDLRLSSPA